MKKSSPYASLVSKNTPTVRFVEYFVWAFRQLALPESFLYVSIPKQLSALPKSCTLRSILRWALTNVAFIYSQHSQTSAVFSTTALLQLSVPESFLLVFSFSSTCQHSQTSAVFSTSALLQLSVPQSFFLFDPWRCLVVVFSLRSQQRRYYISEASSNIYIYIYN